MGGVAGWRIYTELLVPDSIEISGGGGTVAIGGAQINRAELVLRSLSAPAPPFAAEQPFVVAANRIADDFKLLGEKTPIGEIIQGSDITIDPDSLAEGDELIINLTERLQEVADSLDRFGVTVLPRIRIGVRAIPEASTFGYWEFGSASGDTAFAPIIRIIFTPETDFGLPE